MEASLHISELNSTITFLSFKNVIALFSSEMCRDASKSTTHPQTMNCGGETPVSFEDQRFQTYMWRRFDFNDPDASFRGSHKKAYGKDSYIGSSDTDHGHRRVKTVKGAAVRELLSEISPVPKVDYDAIPTEYWTNGSIQGTKQAIEACTANVNL